MRRPTPRQRPEHLHPRTLSDQAHNLGYERAALNYGHDRTSEMVGRADEHFDGDRSVD